MVGDPGGAGGDAGGAADELPGLHDEDSRPLLRGGERRHQAGAAGPDDGDVHLVGDALLGTRFRWSRCAVWIAVMRPSLGIYVRGSAGGARYQLAGASLAGKESFPQTSTMSGTVGSASMSVPRQLPAGRVPAGCVEPRRGR